MHQQRGRYIWGKNNRRKRESRVGEDEGGGLYDIRTRDVSKEFWWMRYNVARKLIGTVNNAPLASDPGKEPHTLILSMLAIHGC